MWPTDCVSAAPLVGAPFVPRDREKAVGAERAEQPRDELREIAVARCDLAVVHVVAQIRRDPHEARQPAGAEVSVELGARDHT